MPSTTFCPSCGAEYLAGVTECSDCHVALSPAAPAPSMSSVFGAPSGVDAPPASTAGTDEVFYDLGDWGQDDRAQAERLLTAANITHRWEVGSDLVVLEADADQVEGLLDEVEEAGAVPPLPAVDDDGEGDDEATYTVMSDLFVAADRLQHDPADAAIAGDFYLAADAAAATPPPFGIDRIEWQQVQELSASLAAALEADADDDAIVRDAGALRGLLARYV